MLEKNGEQFPVDFDIAWKLAGYSTKANAKKRGLKKLEENIDFSYLGMKTPSSGRPSELIGLSNDGFKTLCLMANTETGKLTRKYFIECEKKWNMVKEQHPEIAQQIELARTQQLAAEAQERAAQCQQKLLSTVQAMEVFCPGLAPLALGHADAVVERREYIERVIDNRTGVIYDGVGITYIAKRFGFKSTKQAWAWLESIGYGKESQHWETQLSAVTHHKLPPEKLKELVNLFQSSDRQLFLGE